MKNNKSLFWGLAGLAVIILIGIYIYDREQTRRVAEAEMADRMTAAQQVDEAKQSAAEPKTAVKSQDTATGDGQKNAEQANGSATGQPTTEDTTAETAVAETTDKPEMTASDADSTPAATNSADSDQGPEEKPVETAALDTSVSSGDNAAIVQPDATDAKTADLQPPQFDLLRVEPDGSTVVAGRAKPGGKLEVVAGDTVVAEAKIGSNGDFAAVLDVPLPPGDHEIILRVVEEGEVVSRSEEVATVSVPKDDPAALLVMVTKPGEASRILTRPEMAQAGSSDVSGTASKPSESGDKSPSSDRQVASQTAGEAEADTSAGASPTQVAKADTETMTPQVKDKPADDTAETTKDSGTPAMNKEPQQSAKADDAATEENTQTAALVDKVEDKPAKDSRVPVAVPGARLRIDAVEIESGKVFVAGSAAPPGATVRVYADGVAIGDSRVSASGRFLVEAARDISVGQHIFSADLMMPGSDATSLRVAVPFSRPQGEMVAGVAAPAKQETNAGEGAKQKPAETASTGSKQPAGQETAASDTSPAAKSTGSQIASRETDTSSSGQPKEQSSAQTGISSAQDKTAVAAKGPVATEKKPVVVRKPQVDGSSETAAAPSATAADTSETASRDSEKPAADQASAEPAVGSQAEQERSSQAAEVKTATAPQSEPARQSGSGVVEEQGSADDTDTVRMARAETDPSEPPTIMQPALEARDGSVIIRRGDTLWQISRRVYGRGVRYTTIYLANTDQIANPDFIEPGQVFMVPDEPLANAEELHRERVRRP